MLFFEVICFQNAKQPFSQNTNAKIKIFVKKITHQKMKKSNVQVNFKIFIYISLNSSL